MGSFFSLINLLTVMGLQTQRHYPSRLPPTGIPLRGNSFSD